MELVTTADGSKTLYHDGIGEHYHSRHGALQESKHVFLKSGLQFFLERENQQDSVSVLEVGFGTGLNFLLTADYCTQYHIKLDYCGIEAFPLPLETIRQMGYENYVDNNIWCDLTDNYRQACQERVQLNDTISLHIAHTEVLSFETQRCFDIIYFDAFAAVHQPEMWNDTTLSHVTKHLKPGGVFVTYAITGNLKRSMKALGFTVEKAPGAPGKREMLRAVFSGLPSPPSK